MQDACQEKDTQRDRRPRRRPLRRDHRIAQRKPGEGGRRTPPEARPRHAPQQPEADEHQRDADAGEDPAARRSRRGLQKEDRGARREHRVRDHAPLTAIDHDARSFVRPHTGHAMRNGRASETESRAPQPPQAPDVRPASTGPTCRRAHSVCTSGPACSMTCCAHDFIGGGSRMAGRGAGARTNGRPCDGGGTGAGAGVAVVHVGAWVPTWAGAASRISTPRVSTIAGARSTWPRGGRTPGGGGASTGRDAAGRGLPAGPGDAGGGLPAGPAGATLAGCSSSRISSVTGASAFGFAGRV